MALSAHGCWADLLGSAIVLQYGSFRIRPLGCNAHRFQKQREPPPIDFRAISKLIMHFHNQMWNRFLSLEPQAHAVFRKLPPLPVNGEHS